MSSNNIYYVYAYLRSKDSATAKAGTPYYIGKGYGRRATSKNHSVPVPKDKSKIVFLEKNLTNLGALALERRMIRWYGRKDLGTGILRNRTDGGEGSIGRKGSCPDYVREKISATLTGKSTGTKSEEHRKRLSDSHKGKEKSKEHVESLILASRKRHNPSGKYYVVRDSNGTEICRSLAIRPMCAEYNLSRSIIRRLKNGYVYSDGKYAGWTITQE